MELKHLKNILYKLETIQSNTEEDMEFKIIHIILLFLSKIIQKRARFDRITIAIPLICLLELPHIEVSFLLQRIYYVRMHFTLDGTRFLTATQYSKPLNHPNCPT